MTSVTQYVWCAHVAGRAMKTDEILEETTSPRALSAS